MRLGYSRGYDAPPRPGCASMRPRRMRLGYLAAGRSNRHGGRRRFNEAEAHAPRILIPTSAKIGLCQRFNEAEAHAPRIRRQTSAWPPQNPESLQ